MNRIPPDAGAAPTLRRGRSRQVWFPAAAVVFALAVCLALPAVLRLWEDAIRRDSEQVIRPTRRLISDRKAAVLGGAAARAGYLASGNVEGLRRADRYAQQVDSIDRNLRVMLPKTTPEAVAAFSRLVALDSAVASRFPDRLPSRAEFDRTLPALDSSLARTVAATDSVDLALQDELGDRNRQMATLERLSLVVTGLLTLLGAAAVVSVARLTRREQRARSEAEAAVRLRDEVVSIVSHDLRNPLSTITMAAGFLLEISSPDKERKERKHLEIIGRAAETMNHMIQDLLDIARIESGRLAVDCEPLPARALAQEAATMLAPIVEKAGQTFTCSLPDDLPTIRADRERTLQILSNLVGNAVKFTPPGGSISLNADAEDSRVWFRVSDTGSGIPQENIPRLFDRFWQASRSDRRGIGLGLPIVKALVEAQGGMIRVESRMGEGSTFSFCLPQLG